MNKTELITAIAADTELTKADAEKVVNSLIAVITNNVKKGEK